MGNAEDAAQEARELIRRCLAGEAAAQVEFQRQYGELIYGFPIRVYRTPADEAGDFYVFAFDNGRIYRRLRTFEGRAPLRAYLLGFVLDDLVLEWKRSMRDVETVPIDVLSEMPDPTSAPHLLVLEDSETAAERARLAQVLDRLDPGKAVVMKLLHIEDYELTAEELRRLAQLSGRRVREVTVAVERLRTIVREREAGLKRIEDSIDGVHAWIQLYERRVRRITEDLASIPPGATAAARLREEQAELQQKLTRRHKQRTKLLAQAQRRKVTAPYKEIATLLNTTIGNVASQIARLRQELTAKAGPTLRASASGGCHD